MTIGRSRGGSSSGGDKPKPKGPVNTYTLNDETLAFVKEKAKTSTFFQSLLEGYQQYGSVTEGQMSAIEREAKRDEEYQKRPKLKDEAGELGPINNKVFRDEKPVCFASGCRDLAKVRVGTIGVCSDHVEEAKTMNEEYAAKHATK